MVSVMLLFISMLKITRCDYACIFIDRMKYHFSDLSKFQLAYKSLRHAYSHWNTCIQLMDYTPERRRSILYVNYAAIGASRLVQLGILWIFWNQLWLLWGLTLLMQRPKYCRITWSISWPPLLWSLASPCYQQLCHQLGRRNGCCPQWRITSTTCASV